ncbi:MAG: phosphoribosyltransferase [Rubrobacteraceae bacterium]
MTVVEPGERNREVSFRMTIEVGEVLVSSSEIQRKVHELGGRITEDYKGENLLLVCILRGAVVVLSDLMRKVSLPCEIDFMEVSSYGAGTSSSGVVRILKRLV